MGIRPGRRYLLRWESRGIGSGLAWRVGTVAAPLRASPLRASNDWTSGQLSFVAPQDPGALALFYNRPFGEPRAEGSVELRHIVIEEQPR